MLGSNDNNTHADELSNEAIQDTSGVNQNEQSGEEPTAETIVDNGTEGNFLKNSLQ